jgi:hypothetical protein
MGQLGKNSDGGNPPVYRVARQARRNLRVMPDLGEEAMFIDLSFGL